MSTTSRRCRRLPYVLLAALASAISLAACGGNTIDTADSGTTTLTSAPSSTEGTGVYGLVTAGPTCPVQRVDEPCPPRPVDAAVEARGADGKAKASTHTDSAGRYALRLQPGTYTLVALTGNVFPTCPPVTLIVTADTPGRVDINCDTGIR